MRISDWSSDVCSSDLCRAQTNNRLKFTLPGPMTICDTIADAHYGSRPDMAMAFADLLNAEARELEAAGVDVIQFDEPAFNAFTEEAATWGVEALNRAIKRSDEHTSVLQSLMRISYAVFCLQINKTLLHTQHITE